MRRLIVAMLIGTLALGSPERSRAAVDTGSDSQALVEFDVNDAPKGDIIAIARGDVLLGVDALTLEGAGVPLPAAGGFIRDGRRFVDPANAGPRVRMSYDPSQLILSVAVTAASLQRVDLSARDRPADFSHPSASLDYDVLGIGGFEHQVSLSGAIVSGRDQFVAQDVVGAAYSQPTAFFERDFPARRFEFSAGELATASDQELPALEIVGAAGQRDFGLTPLEEPFPLPVYSGVAAEPSVADVYVGGVLTRSIPVAPGPFALQGIGDATGSNVKIVLRDAQGVIRSISGGSFLNVNLLAAGTTDRSFAAGRDLYSGRALVDSFYRLGVTNHWTAGLHVREDGGLLINALSSDLSVGFTQFHLGAVQAGRRAGYDAYTSFNGANSRLSIGYAALPPTITQQAFAAPQRDFSVSVARTFGRLLQISAQVSRQDGSDQPASESIVANVNVVLPHGVNAALTFERDSFAGARSTNRFSLQFSGSKVRNGGQSVESSNVQLASQGSSLDVRSDPAAEIGPHSEIRLGRDYSVLNYGVASTQGVADASIVQLPSGYAASYELKGGIAVIDGHARLARTADDGFALVEVPGLANTPVYANGRFAGRTGADGTLLVGQLGTYQASTISIHPEDLPLNTQLDDVAATVVPPRRGGSVARFSARFVTLVQGHIRRSDGGALPPNATLQITNGRQQRVRARLDEFDDFVVDRLTPGRWSFLISQAPAQPCAGTFTVPASGGALVDLGTLVCQTQFAAQ